MIRINEAYETLIDPKRRAAYDATVGASPLESEDASKNFKPVVPRRLQQFVAAFLLLLMLPLILRIALFLFRAIWRVIAVIF